MKILVAGSRTCNKPEVLEKAIKDSGFTIDLIIHGGAAGADTLAEHYANKHGIKQMMFKADWNKHGKAAGPIRNTEMIDFISASGPAGLILLWDGNSRGSWDVLKKAYTAGLRIWVEMFNRVDGDDFFYKDPQGVTREEVIGNLKNLEKN